MDNLQLHGKRVFILNVNSLGKNQGSIVAICFINQFSQKTSAWFLWRTSISSRTSRLSWTLLTLWTWSRSSSSPNTCLMSVTKSWPSLLMAICTEERHSPSTQVRPRYVSTTSGTSRRMWRCPRCTTCPSTWTTPRGCQPGADWHVERLDQSPSKLSYSFCPSPTRSSWKCLRKRAGETSWRLTLSRRLRTVMTWSASETLW